MAMTLAMLLAAADAAGGTPSSGSDVLLVPQAALSKYWLPLSSELVKLELTPVEEQFVTPKRKRLRADQAKFGCVNMGYIIEKNGHPSKRRNVLMARFDRPMDKQIEDAIDYVTRDSGIQHAVVPEFQPAPDADGKPVFTSRSIPMLFPNALPAMSPAESERLVSVLAKGCEIQDLGLWVADHGLERINSAPFPALEELLGSAPE